MNPCTNIKFIWWQIINVIKFAFSQIETRTLEEIKDVLEYASKTKTSLTRIMLDNMVVPLLNGDVDVSMLKEAVELINGKFETEVAPYLLANSFLFLFLMLALLVICEIARITNVMISDSAPSSTMLEFNLSH